MILLFSYTLQLVCKNSPETKEEVETVVREKMYSSMLYIQYNCKKEKAMQIASNYFSFVSALGTISQAFRAVIFCCINTENTDI